MRNIRAKLIAACAIVLFHAMSVSGQTVRKHIVDRGETLASIASRYGVTQEDIIQLNPDVAQFVYVGMELSIPEKEFNDTKVVTQTNITLNHTGQNHSVAKYQQNDFEEERKVVVGEIGYAASTFEDVKLSGSYGMSMLALPWKVYTNTYVGMNISPFNINCGLVDSDYVSDVIKFGPAIGYYFTPKIFIAMSLNAVCNVYFEGSDTKSQWGMSLEPTFYAGRKRGVFIGPQFTIGFQENSELSCGFRAGVYF